MCLKETKRNLSTPNSSDGLFELYLFSFLRVKERERERVTVLQSNSKFLGSSSSMSPSSSLTLNKFDWIGFAVGLPPNDTLTCLRSWFYLTFTSGANTLKIQLISSSLESRPQFGWHDVFSISFKPSFFRRTYFWLVIKWDIFLTGHFPQIIFSTL